MARGIVMTAKGEKLNFDELIMKARRPITPQGDLKDKVKPQHIPAPQMRTRGFVPTARGVPVPVKAPVAAVPAHAAIPVVKHPSMADYTGVTIDDQKHLKEKPVDAVGAAEQALQQISNELEQLAPASRRRQRKS